MVRLKLHGEGIIVAVPAKGRRHPAGALAAKGSVEAAVAVVTDHFEVAGANAGHHDLAVELNRDVGGRARSALAEGSGRLAVAAESVVEGAVPVIADDGEVSSLVAALIGFGRRRADGDDLA